MLSIDKTSKVLIKYCWNISIIGIEDLPDVFTRRLGTELFLIILEHKHFKGYILINKISEILLLVRSIKLITKLSRLLDIFRCSDFKEYFIIEKPIYRELVIYWLPERAIFLRDMRITVYYIQ